MITRALLVLVALTVDVANGTLGGQMKPPEVVAWSAVQVRTADDGRRRVVVELEARIDRGWFIYGPTQPDGGPIAMRVGLAARGFTLGSLQPVKPPLRELDAIFRIPTEKYRGTAAFRLRIDAGAQVAAGEHRLGLDVRFQACSANICLPPKTTMVPVTVSLTEGSGVRRRLRAESRYGYESNSD